MARFLYTFAIFLNRIGMSCAAWFNPKAKAFHDGRKNWRNRVAQALKGQADPVAWFHCASLGEFEQGRPVMEAFKREFPAYRIVLTFFSPSGYEVRKNYSGADHIFYLPIDTRSNARDFINLVNPSIAFFVKYEFWHHFTYLLHKKGIPLISFSTIFRSNQLFFKGYGRFYSKVLKRFSHFFLQDLRSKELLDTLNISNSEVSGDTRFDRVWEICSNPKTLKEVEAFQNGMPAMVIGSCWPEDLEILTSFINDSGLKFIIAPHEIDEKFMAQIENDLLHATLRYSQLPAEPHPERHQVLIIDNIGLLSSLYQYGKYAYVGGAFGKGLHNILEPATFGIPVFFGNKNYQKFREAVDLIKLGGAAAVASYDEFRMQFHAFSNPNTYDIACQLNIDYVKNNVGASQRIISYCKQILNG